LPELKDKIEKNPDANYGDFGNDGSFGNSGKKD